MIPTLQLGQFGRGLAVFEGPLDAYTASLWSALSVRRLLSSVPPVITVRESAGSTTQGIGFAADGAFDTPALSTFLAGADGLLRTWDTQAGSSGFDQTVTNSKQPKVATAGVFYGAAYFDGTDDSIASGAATSTNNGQTIFLRGTLRTTAAVGIIAEHSTNYNSNNSWIVYYDNAIGALSLGVHQTGAAGYVVSNYTSKHPNANVQAYRFDRSQVTAAAMTSLFINGALQTRDSNADSGTLPSLTFGSHNVYLGSRNYASSFAALDIHTLLIYSVALSDTDIDAISTILAALP